MTYTPEELEEVRGRLEKELADQGLTVEVTDPAVLVPLARGLNVSLGAVEDEMEVVSAATDSVSGGCSVRTISGDSGDRTT